MPKLPTVELRMTPFCATDVARVYSGWAPSWYGHQMAGEAIRRLGYDAAAKLTVWVLCAATVAFLVTTMAVPPRGVTVALTAPVCDDEDVLVMSTFTVSAELLRLAAVLWLTCALPAIS